MKQLFTLSNQNHAMIVGALVNMVDDEGLTPHEAFEILDNIKNDTFHALTQIHKERKAEHATPRQ